MIAVAAGDGDHPKVLIWKLLVGGEDSTWMVLDLMTGVLRARAFVQYCTLCCDICFDIKVLMMVW